MNPKTTIKKRVIIGLVIVLTALFFIMIPLVKLSTDNSFEIDQNGGKISNVFRLYDNNIYAAVPSNGFMLIPEADITSFQSLNTNYQDAHIGIDKQNVYCGNRIIPDLNPNSIKIIGNNYYTDGRLTFHCSRGTIINHDLNIWNEFWQTINYQILGGKEAQTHLYPITKLPKSNTDYYSIGNSFFATDGHKIYYNGLLMSNANPNSLRPLDLFYYNNHGESHDYFTDEHNVYYQNINLPITNNNKLYNFSVGSLPQQPYLYNPLDGSVFVKDKRFPQENEPYKVLSLNGAHVYQALFLSQNGIYYYDYRTEKVIKAGENPFSKSNIQEIAPLVFYDGTQLFYLEGSETLRNNNKMSDKSLKYRTTHLYQPINTIGKWEKVDDLFLGSIWKNNNQLYYFDEYGHSQLVVHTIYKIVDLETANQLMSRAKPSDILNLIKNEKLVPIEKEEILKAQSYFR